MESLVVTVFDVTHVKIGRCSNALKRVTLLSVPDNLVCRTSSHNKSYLKYENDVVEETSNFSFLGYMSSWCGGLKEVVSAGIGSAKETFQVLSGALTEKHGYFYNSLKRGIIHLVCTKFFPKN